jgi:hypothetical protein
MTTTLAILLALILAVVCVEAFRFFVWKRSFRQRLPELVDRQRKPALFSN